MSRGYIACAGSNTVDVFETSTNTMVTSVSVGNTPISVAITPDLSTVCCSNQGNGSSLIASVSIIDTASLAVTHTVNMPTGYVGDSLAITPDGLTCIVSQITSGTVNALVFIDIATGSITATVPLPTNYTWGGNGPLAISYDGTTVYTPMNDNTGTPRIVWVDIASHAVSNSLVTFSGFAGPESAFDIGISPDGSTLYNAARVTGTIQVIDIATMTGTNVNAMGSPWSLFSFHDGTQVWWTQNGAGSIGQILPTPTTYNQTIGFGTSGYQLRAMAPSIDFSHMYACDYTGTGSGTIYAVDLTSHSHVNFANAGSTPQQMCIGPTIPATPTPPPPTPNGLVTNLFIPRKNSLDTDDLTVNWDTIQRWINNLPHG